MTVATYAIAYFNFRKRTLSWSDVNYLALCFMNASLLRFSSVCIWHNILWALMNCNFVSGLKPHSFIDAILEENWCNTSVSSRYTYNIPGIAWVFSIYLRKHFSYWIIDLYGTNNITSRLMFWLLNLFLIIHTSFWKLHCELNILSRMACASFITPELSVGDFFVL